MNVAFNTRRLTVSNMKAHHLSYMMEIYNNTFYKDATGVNPPVNRIKIQKKYLETVNNPKYFMLMAMEEGQFRGMLKGFYEYDRKVLWISLIAIKEEYLNKGYGRELVDGLEKYFKSLKNCNISFITVKESNHSAKEFWQKIGYAPIEERVEKLIVNTAIVYKKSIA